MVLNYENPLFRKIIVPWYDSTVAIVLMLVFMVLVAVLAAIGIIAAFDMPEELNFPLHQVELSQFETDKELPPLKPKSYHKAVRIPFVLLLMSVSVIISSLRRLILRFMIERES